MKTIAMMMEMIQRIQSIPAVSSTPKRPAMKLPASAPRAPSTMVQMTPRFWSPFMNSRASAPMIAPAMMMPMISPMVRGSPFE